MIERFLGRLLRGFHAGEQRLAWNDSAIAVAPAGIVLKSAAFSSLGSIPQRFAGKGAGDNISPPLNWTNLPPGTRGLVLIMEDPDAPMPSPEIFARGFIAVPREADRAARTPICRRR